MFKPKNIVCHNCMLFWNLVIEIKKNITFKYDKLDRVSPVDNRPSTN